MTNITSEQAIAIIKKYFPQACEIKFLLSFTHRGYNIKIFSIKDKYEIIVYFNNEIIYRTQNTAWQAQVKIIKKKIDDKKIFKNYQEQ